MADEKKKPKLSTQPELETVSVDDIEEVDGLPEEYLKPSTEDLILPETNHFDPEATMKQDLFDTVEAGGRGFLQSGLLGFPDELTGAVESGSMSGPAYEKSRDESRANYAASQKEHPYAYGTGFGTGVLASSALPVVGVASPGASLIMKGAQGALQGGLAAAGSSEAELGSDEYSKDVLKSMALGGTLSTAFPAIFSNEVIGKATKRVVDPVTGLAKDVYDIPLLTKQLAKAGAIGGGTGATIGAALSDDPVEGAKKGLALGIPAGILSRVGVGTGRMIGGTNLADKARKAYKYGSEGELLVGNEAKGRVAKELGKISEDLSDVVQKEVIQKKGKEAVDGVNRVSDRIKNFIQKNKEVKGQKLGKIIEDLQNSEQVLDVTDLSTRILTDIDENVAAGLVDEAKVKGLREQLIKLRETAQPDIKATTINKMEFDPNGQTGLFNAPTKTVKIRGKDVSLEDLQRLKAQAEQATLGNASIAETATPQGALSRVESQDQMLSQAPIPRQDVSIEELVRTKNLIQKGLGSTDPGQKALFKRAYGKLIEDLTSRLDDPKAQALYKELRGEYSNLLKMEDAALTENIGGKLEPSRMTDRAVEQYSAPKVGRQQESLDELLGLMKQAGGSDETVNRIQGQAAAASNNLQDITELSKFNSPEEIAKQIPVLNDPIQYQSSKLRNSLEGLGGIAPDQAASLKQRAGDVASKLELVGETGAMRGTGGISSPKTIASRLAGAPEQLVVGGSNLLGYTNSLMKDQAKYMNVLTKLEAKGPSKLAEIMRGALTKDQAGRAAILYTVQNDPGYRMQLDELSKEPEAPAEDVNIEDIEEVQ